MLTNKINPRRETVQAKHSSETPKQIHLDERVG